MNGCCFVHAHHLWARMEYVCLVGSLTSHISSLDS